MACRLLTLPISKKTNVKDDIISYRRHKTGQLLLIKLVKRVHELISRYARENSPFLFPLLIDTQTDVRKQYQAALRRVNCALKEKSKIQENGNTQQTISKLIRLSEKEIFITPKTMAD